MAQDVAVDRAARRRVRQRRQIKIYRWRDPSSRHGNFGDEITKPLVESLFGLEAIPVPMTEAEMLGAGSIIDHYWIEHGRACEQSAHCLQPGSRSAGDLHVWGSGFILDASRMQWPQPIHVHAVRGALTAARLAMPETALGDPGILASLLVAKRAEKTAHACLVPHYTDHPWIRSVVQPVLPRHWTVVNPEQPVADVLMQIASAELVIASSLHGLIVADSFEIPCIWVATNGPLYGNTVFKFHDYASSRRTAFNAPMNYRDAIDLSASALAEVATTPARSIAEWQEAMVRIFPF